VPTTTVAPTTTSTTSTKSFVLRPFVALSVTLTPQQRRQLNEFAGSITPNYAVTCVGGAGSGPLRLLRDLARQRAMAVCDAVAQRVPGVRTSINVVIRGEIQVGERDPQVVSPTPQTQNPIRVSASDLSRRVLVVARSGD
jgi:hypothetical protein